MLKTSWIGLFLIIPFWIFGQSLKVDELRCEYKENPIGIDAIQPRLSWKLKTEQKQTLQTAYEIRVANSIEDLKGLKMRIPGLGGEVLKRAGGVPVTLPGGEIFPSLQSGALDATEWVGPYNDLAFGLYKAAKYYYTPGWHEPGTTMECMINEAAFNELPADLQSIVRNAIKVANADMLSEYTARNQQALQTLVNKHKVELRNFPDVVLKELKSISEQVVEEEAAKDPLSTKVWASQKAFKEQVMQWTQNSEQAFLKARAL